MRVSPRIRAQGPHPAGHLAGAAQPWASLSLRVRWREAGWTAAPRVPPPPPRGPLGLPLPLPRGPDLCPLVSYYIPHPEPPAKAWAPSVSCHPALPKPRPAAPAAPWARSVSHSPLLPLPRPPLCRSVGGLGLTSRGPPGSTQGCTGRATLSRTWETERLTPACPRLRHPPRGCRNLGAHRMLATGAPEATLCRGAPTVGAGAQACVCFPGNHSGVVLSINSREMHSYLVS